MKHLIEKKTHKKVIFKTNYYFESEKCIKITLRSY